MDAPKPNDASHNSKSCQCCQHWSNYVNTVDQQNRGLRKHIRRLKASQGAKSENLKSDQSNRQTKNMTRDDKQSNPTKPDGSIECGCLSVTGEGGITKNLQIKLTSFLEIKLTVVSTVDGRKRSIIIKDYDSVQNLPSTINFVLICGFSGAARASSEGWLKIKNGLPPRLVGKSLNLLLTFGTYSEARIGKGNEELEVIHFRIESEMIDDKKTNRSLQTILNVLAKLDF